jgi:hypothetical protein
MTCERCNDIGVIERPATPSEVDDGCELGVAFDRCTCPAGRLICAVCVQPVPDDQWRWHCVDCGSTLHYRCAPGGVPVSGPVHCTSTNCDGVMRGVESRAAADARGQGSMFG